MRKRQPLPRRQRGELILVQPSGKEPVSVERVVGEEPGEVLTREIARVDVEQGARAIGPRRLHDRPSRPRAVQKGAVRTSDQTQFAPDLLESVECVLEILRGYASP